LNHYLISRAIRMCNSKCHFHLEISTLNLEVQHNTCLRVEMISIR